MSADQFLQPSEDGEQHVLGLAWTWILCSFLDVELHGRLYIVTLLEVNVHF